MSFTSIDSIVNAVSTNGTFIKQPFYKITGGAAYTAARGYSFFTLGGNPPAGTYSGTALNAVQMSSSTVGSLPLNAAVSPATRHILNFGALSAVATAVPSYLMLVDLLMYYPSIQTNINTLQTLTNGVSLPRYTSGDGVMMFLETTATLGATASNLSVTYTNQAGTASRAMPTTAMVTASIVPQIANTAAAPIFLPLQGLDSGVRSVQSVQLSASMTGSGTCALVLAKPLAQIPLTIAGVASERDLLYQLPSLPQVQDGACLGFLYYTAAATVASTPFLGYVDYAWN